MSNAIDYNVDGGRIEIQIEKERCVIENTGNPMSKEELDHVFDPLYSRDKSQNRRDGHMGMGLFLTKKILRLHGLNVALENMDDGIRAVIRR